MTEPCGTTTVRDAQTEFFMPMAIFMILRKEQNHSDEWPTTANDVLSLVIKMLWSAVLNAAFSFRSVNSVTCPMSAESEIRGQRYGVRNMGQRYGVKDMRSKI